MLSENGYSIILKNTCNSRSKEEKVLKELLDKPIDGLIIEPSKSQILCRHINLYEMLDKYQIPYVFIQGCYPQMADKPCILMDDCKGGYLLTRHLLETGRRNIIGIFKADDSRAPSAIKATCRRCRKVESRMIPKTSSGFTPKTGKPNRP